MTNMIAMILKHYKHWVGVDWVSQTWHQERFQCLVTQNIVNLIMPRKSVGASDPLWKVVELTRRRAWPISANASIKSWVVQLWDQISLICSHLWHRHFPVWFTIDVNSFILCMYFWDLRWFTLQSRTLDLIEMADWHVLCRTNGAHNWIAFPDCFS